MSANLIDVISKSSQKYVHNLTTMKTKKINENFSSKFSQQMTYKNENNFPNNNNLSSSFYDLLNKKKKEFFLPIKTNTK